MKKRGTILTISAVLLLAAAFLGPRLLLRQAQRRVLDQPRLLDASAYLLAEDQSDCIQKLRILADDNTQFITLSAEELDRQAVMTSLRAELKTLAELGAVPSSLRDLPEKDEAAALQRLCVFHPEHALFEILELSSPYGEIVARMDQASGKLLTLSFRMEPAEEQLDLMVNDPGTEWGERQGDAWAKYYGLQISAPELAPAEELDAYLEEMAHADYQPGFPALRMTLRDDKNTETAFCLYCFMEYGRAAFAWKPEPAEP